MSESGKRLKQRLKSPYDEDGEVWDALLTSFGEEFDQHKQSLEAVRENSFIDTAEEPVLNRIGELFDMRRNQDETVGEFRARVKTGLRRQITSATLEEVMEVISVMLNIDSDDVFIDEQPFNEHAAFRVTMPADEVGKLDTTTVNMNNLLNDISPAGVNATSTLETETLEFALMVRSTIRRIMSELEALDIDLTYQDVVVREMSETDALNVHIDYFDVEVREMTETDTITATISISDTIHEHIHDIGLSSSSLNMLSDNHWTDGLYGDFSTGSLGVSIRPDVVVHESIGPVTVRFSIVPGSVTHQSVATVGLSSRNLDGLSDGTWL